MARLVADHDMIAAPAGHRFCERGFWIETFAVLIERCHFDIGAEADGARIRRAAAGQHRDERGLAGTVRANDADAVAALDAR